ncbi:hypothetical protein G9A89_019608 [Geosiphon pyriformis]|nr:hypothetical protein G9A89_019608 [Geosiphon pyriformis]
MLPQAKREEIQHIVTTFLLDNNVAGGQKNTVGAFTFEENTSLNHITRLFPCQYRSKSQVKEFYKEFCQFRSGVRECVRENIQNQYSNAPLTSHVEVSFDSQEDLVNISGAAAIKQNREEGINTEIFDEEDDNGNDPRLLALPEAIQMLIKVEKTIQRELRRMEHECGIYLQDIKTLSGHMSDLICRKIPPEGLGEHQAAAEITEFTQKCDKITNSLLAQELEHGDT